MTVAFVAFRIGQTLILLTGVGCLAYGGYRLLDELRFLATSVPVTGEVVAIRETEETGEMFQATDAYTTGHRYTTVSVQHPVLRFRSPVDGHLHRATSAIGYGGDRFKAGMTLPTRASTRDPGDARHSDFVWRFLVPTLLLLFGIMGTVLPVLIWHTPDAEFGRHTGGGVSLLRSVSPAKAAVAIAALAALGVGLRWWIPRMSSTAVGLLLVDPHALAAAMREEPPPPGRLLGEKETWIARLPMLGRKAATSAILAALKDRRREDLRRYLAAIRDPALRFTIDVDRVPYFGEAIRAGDPDAVRMLIDAGLDPRREPRAVEEAVYKGRATMLRTLGAARGAPEDPADRLGLVHAALLGYDDDVLLALIELGWVDPAWTFAGNAWGGGERSTILDVALVRGLARSSSELERRGVPTASPLLARLVAGDVDGMRALLPEREWSRARVFDAPLLSYAALAGNVLLARRLVGLGADPGVVATVDPHEPELTALDAAVRRGHLEVARFLAGLPGAKAYLDGPGRTRPLCAASTLGRWDLVRVLVDAGASPDVRCPDETTPLHRAARDGRAEVVELLLAHGADPRAEAKDKLLPVELARDDAARAAIENAGGRGP